MLLVLFFAVAFSVISDHFGKGAAATGGWLTLLMLAILNLFNFNYWKEYFLNSSSPVGQNSLSTLVLAELSPSPRQMARVLEFFEKLLPETRQYNGCRGIEVFTEFETGRIVLVEYWETKEKFIAYKDWRTETGAFDELLAMLDSEPVFRFCDHT